MNNFQCQQFIIVLFNCTAEIQTGIPTNNKNIEDKFNEKKDNKNRDMYTTTLLTAACCHI